MLAVLAGCATLTWYGQAARGQIEILAKREDIAQLIADPATAPDLRERLRTVLDIRDFASTTLGLPDSRSYTLYADLGREAPLWNVVATPRYSLDPVTWCYPLVGCLAYRGYFRRQRAQALAEKMTAAGFDTAVFPAAAYSTLGWFADPVLDSMLRLPDGRLAELVFHELSHEMLFVPGDTAFNEAFATFVGRLGARRWLESRNDAAALGRWRAQQRLERELTDLLLTARARLARAYQQAGSDPERAAAKQREFARLDRQLGALAAAHDGWQLETWRARGLNNARLALVATYESGVNAFEALYRDQCGGELDCLYRRARALAEAGADRRAEFLGRGH